MCNNLVLRATTVGMWQPWTAVKGQYLNGGDVTKFDKTQTNNLRGCMENCVRHIKGTSTSSNCRSIIKSKGSRTEGCQLANKRSDDSSINSSPNNDWQYFNRPHWYLGEWKQAYMNFLYLLLADHPQQIKAYSLSPNFIDTAGVTV